MNNIELHIAQEVVDAVKQLYNIDTNIDKITLQKTKKEFEGDITIVTFAFTKEAHKSPDVIGNELGEYLKNSTSSVSRYNVVKGFLNLSISPTEFVKMLTEINNNANFGYKQADTEAPLMMIEYSSPNTNKPLHLGHVRNNLLGHSISEIQKACGWNVVKTNIVNDRGIHICKSMLAWQKFGNNATPDSTHQKGDHLVGDFYVAFDKAYRAEVKELIEKGMSEDEAKRNAPIMQEAQAMLLKWEQGDKDVRALWNMMNSWVYKGFDETYAALGVSFDKIYYESQTYLVGKKEVERGLDMGIFYRRDDGSVWANLTADGLDEKLLLRTDGTSVYMTQDIGTAKMRYADYPINKMVYVVGNEQNYHFQVLSLLLDKLGFEWGKSLVHFSYGMVELPEGKMKSREGTVVDADDLMAEMITTARSTSEELGKLNDCSEEEKQDIARIVGLGALKYFILKVDPRKNMTFNPKESIDFNGNTGPFIQYTHARIKSLLRKAVDAGYEFNNVPNNLELSDKECALIQSMSAFPSVVNEAGTQFSPALIANYAYELVKEYNQFYHDYSILREENAEMRAFRLMLSANVAKIIANAMRLLGIEVPERM